MRMKTTRWSPDTCDCVIEYDWDADLPAEARVHTPSRVVNRCPAHQAQADAAAVFTTLLDENPRKNKLLARAMDLLTDKTEAVVQLDGSTVLQWRNGVTVGWAFDAARVLEVSISGLTNPQRNAVQNAANNMFGANKVRIL